MKKLDVAFIPGQFSAQTLLAALLQENRLQDCMLYEHANEARIVIGIRYRIRVTNDEVVLEGFNLPRMAQPISKPFSDVAHLFSQIKLPTWTAYGYIGFDVVRHYSEYTKQSPVPLLDLIIPETEIIVMKTGLTVRGPFDAHLLENLKEHGCNSDRETAASAASVQEAKLSQPQNADDKARYIAAVGQVQTAIRDGELLKAIVSRQVKMPGTLDLLATYEAAKINKAARSFCFQMGGVRGVGCSPELLLKSDHKGHVMTGPLAGTRPRGEDPVTDAKLRAELHSDPKEIMEHAISILLAQEELRSVCDANSVYIKDFMEVKQFRRVQHLSSQVHGKLRSDKTMWDALTILFPGITVSGVPKAAALRVIDQVESEPRGVYAGAVGWIDSNGASDLAIALRSVFEHDGVVQFNAGAGIVEGSKPSFEYTESFNKMNTMLERTVLTSSPP